MRARGHLRLLAVATLVWLAFLLAGWPGYYRQYSASALVAFEVLLLGPVAAAGLLALRRRGPAGRMRHAIRLSFYFSAPLFLYDLAYCGVHLGHGLRFVAVYWWLTVYYFVPWAIFPATAAWLDRRERLAAGSAPGEP